MLHTVKIKLMFPGKKKKNLPVDVIFLNTNLIFIKIYYILCTKQTSLNSKKWNLQK